MMRITCPIHVAFCFANVFSFLSKNAIPGVPFFGSGNLALSCLRQMSDVKSEEDKHSAMSVAFFSYMNPLLALGFQRQLTEDDLPELCGADKCRLAVNTLEERWRFELSAKGTDTSLFRALYARRPLESQPCFRIVFIR